MARKLTKRQERALGYMLEKGEATITEVADALDMHYTTAQQALYRLNLLGLIWKDRLGDGTNKVLYTAPQFENPDSDDPLERAFAAPAAEDQEADPPD